LLVHALPFKAHRDAQCGCGPGDEFAHAVLHAGGDDKVLGLVLLQHHPLHAHIVLGVAPVAQGIHIAHVQALLQSQGDVGQATGDLAGYKGFAPARAFVVEQDAVTGIHAIGLAVVDRDPVGIELGHCVWAARVKGGAFLLRDFLHQAIQLAGGCLVEAGLLFQTEDADRFQHAQRAHAVHVGCVFGGLEGHGHMALGAQVVDFVGLHFLNDASQVAGVAEVAVVQLEARIVDVRVLVDVVHALGVEGAGAALDAVHDVAFFQQQLSQIGAVLAGYAGDECNFWLGNGCLGHVNVCWMG